MAVSLSLMCGVRYFNAVLSFSAAILWESTEYGHVFHHTSLAALWYRTFIRSTYLCCSSGEKGETRKDAEQSTKMCGWSIAKLFRGGYFLVSIRTNGRNTVMAELSFARHSVLLLYYALSVFVAKCTSSCFPLATSDWSKFH